MRTTARRLGLFGLVLSCTVLAGLAQAQDAKTLRWKFEAGEKLHYVMAQDINQKITSGDTPIEMKVNQTMDMTMSVESVADGVATIKQTIDRARMKMDGPQGMKIEYDSAAEKEPEGMGKMIATAFEAVVNKPFTVKMSPRGEVIELKVPEGMQESLQKSAGGAGKMVSEQMLKQMSEISVLPEEAVGPGKSWNRKVEVDMPGLGKQTIENKFTYQGMEQRDGKELAKIDVQMEMKPADDKAAGPMKIQSHQGKGTIWFNNAEGQLQESEIKSTMKAQITVGTTSMSQEMDMNQKMKLQPKQ